MYAFTYISYIFSRGLPLGKNFLSALRRTTFYRSSVYRSYALKTCFSKNTLLKLRTNSSPHTKATKPSNDIGL